MAPTLRVGAEFFSISIYKGAVTPISKLEKKQNVFYNLKILNTHLLSENFYFCLQAENSHFSVLASDEN